MYRVFTAKSEKIDRGIFHVWVLVPPCKKASCTILMYRGCPNRPCPRGRPLWFWHRHSKPAFLVILLTSQFFNLKNLSISGRELWATSLKCMACLVVLYFWRLQPWATFKPSCVGAVIRKGCVVAEMGERWTLTIAAITIRAYERYFCSFRNE